jgi:hypothetical protein
MQLTQFVNTLSTLPDGAYTLYVGRYLVGRVYVANGQQVRW